ncbi:uracil-DNA glycosylase family protein [Xanthobacter sp. TB0136]|uniref:uracil-DNA glycosylase family protein n=1 Tax=Xanthobacter sp. TB0136 TaxID=3459177 RepID=UPI004039D44F
MQDPTLFCSGLRARIETFEREHGYGLGWRLLASPAAVLEKADIAFIGLNPAGQVRPPDHPDLAPAQGSAYSTESWAGHAPGESPLQKQARTLFHHLGVRPEQVLAGNLVPFRSPSWAELPHRKAARTFGETLWKDILARARPRLVICMGAEVFGSVGQLLEAGEPCAISLGWGKIQGARARFGRGTIIRLPHLSRFRIITRAESRDGLKSLFAPDWRP